MNCTYYFSILSVQPASYIWRHVSVDVPIGFISFFNALRLRAVVAAHYHQLLYVEKQQNKTKHRLTYYPRIETFMLKQILCWAKFWQFFKDPWTLIPCNVPLFIAFSLSRSSHPELYCSPHTEKPWTKTDHIATGSSVGISSLTWLPVPQAGPTKGTLCYECVTRTAPYCRSLWLPSTLHTLPYSPLCLRL